MNGRGKLVYPNEEVYEGDWVFGKRHGQGTYYYLDGGSYRGQWENDKINGTGVSLYANGNRYEGEWKDGIIDGQVCASVCSASHRICSPLLLVGAGYAHLR